MTIDTNVKVTDLIIWGTAIIALLKLIITNRDILRNVVRMVGEHEKKINRMQAVIDEHDDIIIRNGLDLRADYNLTRRHRIAHPEDYSEPEDSNS